MSFTKSLKFIKVQNWFWTFCS